MDPLEFILILVVILYLAVFTFHILYKCTSLEPQLKYYHYGLAFFALMFMLARIFFLLNDLFYEATLDPTQKQGMFYLSGSICSGLAVLGIMYVVERYVYKKLHYIPTLVVLISTGLMAVLPKINETNVVTIYSTISSLMAIIIPLLYIIVGYQVSGQTRKKSFILAFAIIILFLGNLFNTGFLKDAFPLLKIISPITILIGFVIFHYGLLFY